MPHIYQKRPDTRLHIVQLAAKLFIEEGYSNASFSKIAKTLDLSTGNITFFSNPRSICWHSWLPNCLIFSGC